MYITVLLLKKYLTSKIEKKKTPVNMGFFAPPLILERQFSKLEMSLSQKYIWLALISKDSMII